MRNKIQVFFFLVILFSIESAYSQDITNDSLLAVSTINMFREPSYIMLGSGIGNMESLLFEGDIVPYYMLSMKRNIKWGIQLSPRITVRMSNKYSHPVRTPSFIPTVTFFYHLIDSKNENRDLFTYCSWYHHSNGQEGDFYSADSTSINTTSGSFYSNWLEGGVFLSRQDPELPYTSNYVRLYAAYNYMLNKELKGIYGRLRFYFDLQSTINLSKGFKIFRGSDNNHSVILNQSLHFGWIAGNLSDTKFIDKKRFAFRYTLSFKPSFLKDVNLFCQYYYGQDYYNINFNRTLNVFRFGIASKIKTFN
jgi:hypothetical protein